MKRSVLLSLIILLAEMIPAEGQTSFWDGPDAYLGQKPPGETPVKFAPSLINNNPFFSMDRCAFSPDGKEFYCCSNDTWFSTEKATVQTYRFTNKWIGPSLLVPKYYAPTFSMDGNTLYFLGGGKGGVFQMHRTAAGWTKPETY